MEAGEIENTVCSNNSSVFIRDTGDFVLPFAGPMRRAFKARVRVDPGREAMLDDGAARLQLVGRRRVAEARWLIQPDLVTASASAAKTLSPSGASGAWVRKLYNRGTVATARSSSMFAPGL